jgi:hypothetical protein
MYMAITAHIIVLGVNIFILHIQNVPKVCETIYALSELPPKVLFFSETREKRKIGNVFARNPPFIIQLLTAHAHGKLRPTHNTTRYLDFKLVKERRRGHQKRAAGVSPSAPRIEWISPVCEKKFCCKSGVVVV